MKKWVYIFSVVFVIFSCKNEKEEWNTSLNDVTISEVKFVKLDSAILASGRLFRADSFPSQYITPRPVDIWLPKDYSTNRKYSVLYMHDGQMLFDSTTTWNKQEWKVDEWATQLMGEDKTKDFIVVAVHNIPKIRWKDLFPQKAFEFLDDTIQKKLIEEAVNANMDPEFNGDNYLRFIVDELKPSIDNTYSVHTDKNNTYVMGSSMGGLMSMYAISEYPMIFGGAGCLSTHWVGAAPRKDNPLPEAIFSYMEENFPKAGNHKVYFDYGNKTLDQFYPQYAPRVDRILKAKGYTESNSKNLFFEGTDHSENSWNKRLDQPLLFLLGK
jgi:enterochelin esterase-like enzyme